MDQLARDDAPEYERRRSETRQHRNQLQQKRRAATKLPTPKQAVKAYELLERGEETGRAATIKQGARGSVDEVRQSRRPVRGRYGRATWIAMTCFSTSAAWHGRAV